MTNSSRVHLVATLAMGSLLAIAGCGVVPGTVSGAEPMFVYVGTYAPEDEPGIYIYRFDPATGALSEVGAVAGIRAPSFQALHPSGRFLYSVSESGDYAGQRAGAICAYAIDPQTGGLTLLNCQSSQGPGPCHVCVDRAGRHVLAANYSGGSVVVLPLRPDGQLEAASSFEQHRGASVNPARQEGPHAHCVNVDPAGRYVLAADLGTDQVMIYQYDADHGQLIPNPALPAATVTPGAGPRHFAFHPQGKWGYLINELNSTVTAFTYDAGNGSLTAIHDISTLPAGFTGKNSTAEIAVSPDLLEDLPYDPVGVTGLPEVAMLNERDRRLAGHPVFDEEVVRHQQGSAEIPVAVLLREEASIPWLYRDTPVFFSFSPSINS